MKLSVLERDNNELPEFLECLRKKLNAIVSTTLSVEDAKRQIARERGAIDILIVTIDESPVVALTWFREILEYARNLDIRPPRFLLLSWSPLADRYSSILKKLGALGVRYLLRQSLDQILEDLKQIAKDSASADGPTIRMEYVQGHWHFYLVGSAATVEWKLGPKILVLLAYFANHPFAANTTAMISEATGISLYCVKIYMERLRKAFDCVRIKAGITSIGSQVFRTVRGTGGFLHSCEATFVR